MRTRHSAPTEENLPVWGSLVAGETRADDTRPNVLVIVADDLVFSDLGCYAGEIETPHLDALARRGVRLTQMYTSARCCPSRASLLTGLYPSQAGIADFTSDKPEPKRGSGYLGLLNEQCVTLVEALGPTGYGCYYVGKWHMHPQTGPIKRGFHEFYGYTKDHSHDQYDAAYYPADRKPEINPPADQFYATDVFNRGEMDDLASREPERVESMVKAWETWARRVQVLYEEPKSP